MVAKLDSLKSNVELEVEGDWIDVPELPGVSLQVRSINYPGYQTALSLVVQRLTRKYGRKPVPPQVNDREMGRLYHEHILVNWRGFDVEYSAEVAESALTDPAHRDLRRHVQWAASQVGVAEVDYVEDAKGN